MPFSNKDQNDGTFTGRARANSTTQTISPVTLQPIKTERGTAILHSISILARSPWHFHPIKCVDFIDFTGIRAKICNLFNFVSRDKSNNRNPSSTTITPAAAINNNNNNNSNNSSKDSSSARSGFSVYKKGFTMLSRSDGFLNKSVVRPLELTSIPKLEVTSPHNFELIRKYEKRYSLGSSENEKPPALPPRRASKQIF